MKYSKKKKRKNKKIFTKQKKKKYQKKTKKYLRGGAAEEPPPPRGPPGHPPPPPFPGVILTRKPPPGTLRPVTQLEYNNIMGRMRLEELIRDEMYNPPPPKLRLEPSGENFETIRKNILRTNSFLDKNIQCKTPNNCEPVAADAISESGLDPSVLTKWIIDTEKDVKFNRNIRPRPNNYGLYKMEFLRNFSSRPPIQSLGETEEKIWTHEPLIDFLSDLIKSGIQKKENFDPQNPDHIFVDGCIHLSLKKPYPMDGHSILFCQDNDENYIIDLQLTQNLTFMKTNRGIVGPDKELLNNYLAAYTPNSFSINTQQFEKYQEHNNNLQLKLLDVSINNELNNLAGEKMIPDLNDLSQHDLVSRILYKTCRVFSKITPAILANPYQLIDEPLDPILPDEDADVGLKLAKYRIEEMQKTVGSQLEQNKKWLTPLIFHFNENVPWPDSVKEKAQKYSKFQDNKYTRLIRQTALTSILNGKNNQLLEDILHL